MVVGRDPARCAHDLAALALQILQLGLESRRIRSAPGMQHGHIGNDVILPASRSPDQNCVRVI